jgi:hypothetical protein
MKRLYKFVRQQVLHLDQGVGTCCRRNSVAASGMGLTRSVDLVNTSVRQDDVPLTLLHEAL